ncbi:hypothetical protein LZD49_02450 [Dyadobacter sp. CY261]|uniref:ATP-binding protein n=1 Tax=Dyadobacter sp. CY261 TaxID=2907203 RepID=UPI001F2A061F|nr:ATP-binding protein [Dyadobacter sp. CY261]MCF0069314.1 hypothetical protein [Dyadobacter sp. CY261]
MVESEKKSPFKFLDHYTKADRSFFFGRDKEIQTLYDFVNKNRVVLIYGQSGTGKTSIIQCGLANEFEVTDWMPVYIRRGGDLNNSINHCIHHKYSETPDSGQIAGLKEILFDEGANSQKGATYSEMEKAYITGLIYNIRKLTELYLRPVYLIFDQFEELLILAPDDEKKLFIKMLKILLGPNAMVDCHIIIVMREEYFAWLDTFEKDIPGLSDRRLRIEPMRRAEIKNVITESCQNFNITLVDPDRDAEQIIGALSERSSEVSLPYLQVYLDQLWRIDYQRTYPQGYVGTALPPPLEFTNEEITQFGEMKDVLQRFLQERKKELQTELEDFENVPVQFINRLLDSFVNEQGTKRPHVFEAVNGYYIFTTQAPRLFHETDKELLKFTLDFLQNSQILRNEGNSFELGHDILAKLIDRQRDAKIQKLNGIPVMVQYYRQENKYIPHEIIKDWERYDNEIQLRKEDNEWYLKSKNFWAADKKKRNAILIVLAIVAALISFYSIYVKSELNKNERINKIISSDYSDDKEQLIILKNEYDNGSYDSVTTKALENAILRVVQSAQYASRTASKNFTIESTAELWEGLDVDISADGKYVSIKNDDVSEGGKKDKFSLLDMTRDETVITSFEDIKYAYFLNSSDTLLLALTNSASKVLADLPSRFILYDCKRNVLIDTVNLNQSGYVKYLLYNKEFLHKYTYSNRDSYKIRRLASGKLVVPCLNNSKVKENGLSDFDIRTTNRLVLVINAQYSISTAPNNTRFMYCVERKKNFEFRIYDDNKIKDDSLFMLIPESSFRQPGVGIFADFTEENSLVFSRSNTLHLQINGKIKDYTAPTPLTTVYSGRHSNYLLATDIDDEYTYLIDYRGNATANRSKATITGYDFKSQTFILHERILQGDSSEISRLLAKDFGNTAVRQEIKIKGGIESTKFNPQSGCILVKTKQSQGSSVQLLYLYDNRLSLKASYYITPNDTYAFSKNGENFYIIRNNELLIFKNEIGPDLSNFEEVNKMLNEKAI